MLHLLLTVDVDADGASRPGTTRESNWDSVAAIPEFRSALGACEEHFGHEVPVTWFVRADDQVARSLGHATALLERVLSFSGAVRATDEMGWHPHLYRETRLGGWAPEPNEASRVEQMTRTHEQMRSMRADCTSGRIGEAAGSLQALLAFAALGYRVDSSAIPGRTRDDADRCFDWSITPNEPYVPSRLDARRPAQVGEVSLAIVEVPMTTVPFQASYDDQPLLRYVNLAYHPHVFRRGVSDWMSHAADDPGDKVLTLVTHPDEWRSRSSPSGLYAYTPQAGIKNLTWLVDELHRRELAFRFRLCRDIPALMPIA